MSNREVLYAPNVHTGGGFVLLQSVIGAWPSAGPRRIAFLDQRASTQLVVPPDVDVHWVRPSVRSRLAAEVELRKHCGIGDKLLCFHGLPPWLPNPAHIVVFQQNRIYLGEMPLRSFAFRTALRLAVERCQAKLLRHRVATYVVQSDTMARTLRDWYGSVRQTRCEGLVQVLPFMGAMLRRAEVGTSDPSPQFDLIYVSDGVAHKNHLRLIAALELLAQQGICPKLAITLGPRDQALADEIARRCCASGLLVQNLGHCDHSALLAHYTRARALIFPSLTESFGLPLIEAKALGLPILAPELDYVRDVCEPVQTFDPLSEVSIARAIRRFLGQPEALRSPGSAVELWDFLARIDAPGQRPGAGHG